MNEQSIVDKTVEEVIDLLHGVHIHGRKLNYVEAMQLLEHRYPYSDIRDDEEYSGQRTAKQIWGLIDNRCAWDYERSAVATRVIDRFKKAMYEREI
jgi:hypothetical protein